MSARLPLPPTEIVRFTSADDFKEAVRLGDDEGWDEGSHAAALFYSADPLGFWKCVNARDGALVSCACGVAYARPDGKGPPPLGFIGFYITKPDMRGRGAGLRVFQHVIADLQARGCETIGLDAVLAQESNYRRSGFTTRYYHVAFLLPPGSPGRSECASAAPPAGVRLDAWGALDFGALSALDARLFGAARPQVLRALSSYGGGVVCLAALDPATGVILGYGAVRECAETWCVGPLNVAASADAAPLVARALLRALVASAPRDRGVTIYVPETHVAAVAAVEELRGAVREEPLARMYTAGPPRGLDESAVWATSFLAIG